MNTRLLRKIRKRYAWRWIPPPKQEPGQRYMFWRRGHFVILDAKKGRFWTVSEDRIHCLPENSNAPQTVVQCLIEMVAPKYLPRLLRRRAWQKRNKGYLAAAKLLAKKEQDDRDYDDYMKYGY